jgi:phosphatidylserine/phosphatidylglycerophosphate/cardiolipin synthase-like enzyme
VTGFEAAAAAAVEVLGPDGLERLAAGLAAGRPRDALLAETGGAEAASAVCLVLDALTATGDRVAPDPASAYLRGLAAGYEQRAASVQAEIVWTGPSAFDVPVRATAQVLTGLAGEARRELILTTYSARSHPPLRAALRGAGERGVSVWIVVETLQGAGSALAGDEPVKAFADLPGVQFWTWATACRPDGAKMHAKLAVADERVLFVGSANLTAGGVDRNIEAGVLVRGGSTARRAAEHLRALRRDGALIRI